VTTWPRAAAALAAACLILSAAPAAAQDTTREEPPMPPVDSRGLDAISLDAGRRARIDEALRTGAYGRAQALLLEEFERNPRSPELLRLLGGVLFVTGEYLDSAIALKKAEALAPLDERSRFTLAMAYVVLRQRRWARPELEALAAAHPDNPLYPYWIARLQYDDEHYAAAAEGFRRVLALDPAHLKAHDNLGLAYEALGRYDEAVQSHQNALRLDREAAVHSPWPALNLGLLLTRLDRGDEAEPLFRESAARDPRFAQARYQLGLVHERKGQATEAMAELREAARIDPRYAEPHYALARLYRRVGDAAKADAALERFLALKKEKGQAGSP
jgi:tetratricopeptide (TPR) repeat protein